MDMASSSGADPSACARFLEEFVGTIARGVVPDHLHTDFQVRAVPGHATVEVMVSVRDPSEAAGRLTGRGGSTVNAVQDLARAAGGARFQGVGIQVSIVRVERLSKE